MKQTIKIVHLKLYIKYFFYNKKNKGDGNICGRRHEVDTSWLATILRETRRDREEQKTERFVGRIGVQPSCDFRVESEACDRVEQVVGRLQLS
jgi:hypothetical protein